MRELIKFTNQTDLTDYKIIIPSVSVGNVPQLTVDLIISTYNLKKVASIWHPGIIPAVGGDPYTNTNELSTSCELYVNEGIKLAAVQLRSGVESKFIGGFVTDLKRSLIDLKIKSVVVLTSAFAHEMHDVTSSKFRFLCGDGVEVNFNVPKLESEDDRIAPGSGYAGILYNALKGDVQTVVLMKYCSEGDNRPDAMAMLELLSLGNERVKFPMSWNLIFGNPPPIGVY